MTMERLTEIKAGTAVARKCQSQTVFGFGFGNLA
jgi:hypothetical protein